MVSNVCKCAIFLFFVGLALGFPQLADHIPNGSKVKNPACKSQIWLGVGHKAVYGSGERNAFGAAISNILPNYPIWTKALCNADSDGDGKTNGEELGDPNCKWVKGARVQGPPTGHPGICEPINSAKCQAINDWTITGCL